MKKIMVSLATASLIASSAMAADKGIDIKTSGQAAFYYETNEYNGAGDPDLFDKVASKANVGVQLNFDADLKNDFSFGSQLTYLGNLGMDKNIADSEAQHIGDGTSSGLTEDIALTKFWVAKKIGNTTIKLGRQELPKSLSPFAFSEGWNVFKNTFDAALIVNTDIPDTTLVGTYVDQGNSAGNKKDFGDFDNNAGANAPGAYLLTVVNKSIPMATVTASYYSLADGKSGAAGKSGADIVWGDLAIADKSLPMGLKVGLQGGYLSPDDTATVKYDDTTAYGAKLSLKPIKALTLCVAGTWVDGDDNKANMAVANVITGNKTPLYTQMIANQGAIKLDADTYMGKAVYNTGAYGKIIAVYSDTDADKQNTFSNNDYSELDLVYKIKAGGVNYLAAWVHQDWDKKTTKGFDENDKVRFVARYNF